MSLGMRSGVNWMRLKAHAADDGERAATSVLPRPGAPSTSTCPLASSRDEHPLDELLLPDDDARHLLLDAFEVLLKRSDWSSC